MSLVCLNTTRTIKKVGHHLLRRKCWIPNIEKIARDTIPRGYNEKTLLVLHKTHPNFSIVSPLLKLSPGSPEHSWRLCGTSFEVHSGLEVSVFSFLSCSSAVRLFPLLLLLFRLFSRHDNARASHLPKLSISYSSSNGFWPLGRNCPISAANQHRHPCALTSRALSLRVYRRR